MCKVTIKVVYLFNNTIIYTTNNIIMSIVFTYPVKSLLCYMHGYTVDIQFHPAQVNISERFAAENVTVILKWIQENDIFYNVSIEPKNLTSLKHNGSTDVKLIILYNTLYNVDVTASSIVCDSITSYHTNISLIYSK